MGATVTYFERALRWLYPGLLFSLLWSLQDNRESIHCFLFKDIWFVLLAAITIGVVISIIQQELIEYFHLDVI